MPNILTAARLLAKWSVKQAAVRSGLDEVTVRLLEQADVRPPSGEDADYRALRDAFEQAAIVFADDSSTVSRFRQPVGAEDIFRAATTPKPRD